MKVRAFIFARGGSKGIPRKNVRLLAGRPLIAHSIEIALRCPELGRVVVSTDDSEIAQTARDHGADVPFMRPAELATDSASEWLAWRHAVEWVEANEEPFDLFVSLPATSPFRSVEDVQACLAMMHEHPDTDVAITVRKAERSPYFNMVRQVEDGLVGLVIPPAGTVVRRQDAPQVFDMTTVAYVARTRFIREKSGIFQGRVRAVEVPAERALDIDTPYDFKLAEFLAQEHGTR